MLDFTLGLLLSAIVCALLGFLGLLGSANSIANDLAVALLTLAVIAAVVGLLRRRACNLAAHGAGRPSARV